MITKNKTNDKTIKNSFALFLVGSLLMTSLWGCGTKKDITTSGTSEVSVESTENNTSDDN